jgi:hypothetical protein
MACDGLTNIQKMINKVFAARNNGKKRPKNANIQLNLGCIYGAT